MRHRIPSNASPTTNKMSALRAKEQAEWENRQTGSGRKKGRSREKDRGAGKIVAECITDKRPPYVHI